MCDACDAMYNQALATFGTTEMVEDFLAASGIKEFRKRFGGYDYNPMYESEEELEEEEVPCFDTFPAPAPQTMTFPNYPSGPTKISRFDQ